MKPYRPRYLFCLMFSIFLLLNINYAMLRGIRNTIAVVTLGGGAHSIPIFELFGALPGAFFMTWGLAWLMNRFSIKQVFFLTLAVFLVFYLTFAIFVHSPLSIGNQAPLILSMLFYVMAELWKPALAGILFWGLVNQHIPIGEAKRLYAPLALGGSLGSILAGPIISLCTSKHLWQWFPLASEHWTHSFNLMITLIVFIGIIAGFFYYKLYKFFMQHSQAIDTVKNSISLKDSIAVCLQSPPLRLLSWIVIADYIAYGLGEVIFLHVLKTRFPEASDYCNYMGHLTFWNGVLTFISGLAITPLILQRYQWVVAALVTPICLLITEGLFFLFIRSPLFGWREAEWIEIVILLGSIQYCVCRAAKYTLFDTSRELAFVSIPFVQRMKGKLVVDGLSARLGRAAASILSISLIQLSGGVMASSMVTGVIAITMALSWTRSTWKLGKFVDIAQHILAQ